MSSPGRPKSEYRSGPLQGTPESAPSHAAAANPLSVLYVEDFALGAALIRDTLNRRAPEIRLETVTTVAQAIERLNRFESGRAGAVSQETGQTPHYDVVLTDLDLPDGLGLEILAHVRGRRLMLAVVILTASVEEDTLRGALQAGADSCIAKRGDYLARLPGELHRARGRLRYGST